MCSKRKEQKEITMEGLVERRVHWDDGDGDGGHWEDAAMFSIWLSAQAFWHCHLFSSREAGYVMVLALCVLLCVSLSLSLLLQCTHSWCMFVQFWILRCNVSKSFFVRIKVSTCCYILCKVSLKAILPQAYGEGLWHTLQRGCWVQNRCKIHSRCHFVTVVKPAAIGGGVAKAWSLQLLPCL
jgi:hypothetical protein